MNKIENEGLDYRNI